MFWVAVWIGLVGTSWVSLVHAGGSSDVLMPAYAAIALGAGIGTDIILRLETRYQGVVGAVLAVVLAVQVIQLSHRPLHEIPSAASEAAGHRFIALVASLPGQVIVADHPWYDTMAGKTVVGPVRGRARCPPGRPEHGANRSAREHRIQLHLPLGDDRLHRQPRGHHRAGVRPVLQARPTGLHLRPVLFSGDRRAAPAVPALRQTLTFARWLAVELGEVAAVVVPRPVRWKPLVRARRSMSTCETSDQRNHGLRFVAVSMQTSSVSDGSLGWPVSTSEPCPIRHDLADTLQKGLGVTAYPDAAIEQERTPPPTRSGERLEDRTLPHIGTAAASERRLRWATCQCPWPRCPGTAGTPRDDPAHIRRRGPVRWPDRAATRPPVGRRHPAPDVQFERAAVTGPEVRGS